MDMMSTLTDEIITCSLANLMVEEKHDAFDLYIHNIYANFSHDRAEKIVSDARFLATKFMAGDAGI